LVSPIMANSCRISFRTRSLSPVSNMRGNMRGNIQGTFSKD
jgi:hypothetical protein